MGALPNPNSNPHSRTVLFVDDEPALIDGMHRSLRKQPWELMAAHSGPEALEILARMPVHVIVSDQNMPGMSGPEFLRIARARYPDTVRLMLTGEDDPEVAARAVNEAEVFRFLRKPCPPEELAVCLEAAFELVSSRRDKASFEREDDFLRAAQQQLFGAAMQTAWMAFQPVVDPRTGRTVAFESLLRLRHPEVPHPGVLLELAEAVDGVPQVEDFVTREVGRRIPEAPAGASILINVHPRTLEQADFAHHLDPLLPFASRVVLEIIERDALVDTVELQNRLEEIRERGFRIAVDDLGAGYSGLTSFVLLRPDIVKFDMSLVRGIDTDETRTKLVGALANLCRDLGITTIAEGVETRAELERVVEIGCDWVQGFVYAPAAREFVEPV